MHRGRVQDSNNFQRAGIHAVQHRMPAADLLAGCMVIVPAFTKHSGVTP